MTIKQLVHKAWDAEKNEHLIREDVNAKIRAIRSQPEYQNNHEAERGLTDPLIGALCEACATKETAFTEVAKAWATLNQLPYPRAWAQVIEYLAKAEDSIEVQS